MYVYWVCRAVPVHHCDCQRFNSQYERVRVHTAGVWFDKAKAQEHADGMNRARKNWLHEPKFFVKGYKVRDAEQCHPQAIEENGSLHGTF